MPKAPTNPASPTVKSDPYPPESPTKSPSKGRGAAAKGVTFTEEMDRKIINHILSISDINLRYNWPDLIKKEFPTMNTKQASTPSLLLKNRWDHKLKGTLFPPEVMKMSKQAKEGGKDVKGEAGEE